MHGFVLVVLNRPDTARPCLNAAAQVADAMNEAWVEALCVRLDLTSTIFPSEEILTNERRENDAAHWAAAANRAYNTWLGEHSDWAADRTSWSDPVSTIQHQVRVRGSGA